MKFKTVSSTSEGGATVRVTADSPEDMWHIFNLVERGDSVTSLSDRKVSRETAGGTAVERITVRLAVVVTEVSFDPETGALRVSGSNTTENDHVRIGAYHTLEVGASRQLVGSCSSHCLQSNP
jgi:protein pelota